MQSPARSPIRVARFGPVSLAHAHCVQYPLSFMEKASTRKKDVSGTTPEETADFSGIAEKHSVPAACRILLNTNEFLFVN